MKLSPNKIAQNLHLTPEVLLNFIQVLRVLVTLDKVSIFTLSFSKNLFNVENSKCFEES